MKFVRPIFCLGVSILLSGTVSAVSLADRAARAQKGILVLQVGSDWCVSGEDVRNVFLSRAFERSVGGDYVLVVYDDMDNPTGDVKRVNAEIGLFRVKTRRYPAITCITPRPNRFFAQIENIPRTITAEKLAFAIKRVTAVKDEAEKLFREAERTYRIDQARAADLYGNAFRMLSSMAGEFSAASVYKGGLAYIKEWDRLCELDKGDRHGWVRRFTMGYGVDLVTKATKFASDGNISGGKRFIAQLKSLPTEHLKADQKQAIKMAEYAFYRRDVSRKEANLALLEEAFAIGRDTFWGQCAMGYLILSGKKIIRKQPEPITLRERPSGVLSELKPFPLEKVRRSISSILPGAPFTEQMKKDIARYAVLRRIGETGWDKLGERKGSWKFLSSFLDERTWLEDFVWNGPCDGPHAVLALETICYQDDGRWITAADGTGRRFATALALEFSLQADDLLVDFFNAYRTTYEEGRLHKHALTQPVWQWRCAIHQGKAGLKFAAAPAQQRFLSRYVNMPERHYGGAHCIVPYRLFNCFGESIHTPKYYAPWDSAGEWPKRRYSPILGGVCGELSTFGSACANAHGLPSFPTGQPGHCAYTRRRINGRWEICNSVTHPTFLPRIFWHPNSWSYLSAMEGTFEGSREKRLDADRYIELAHLAAERKEGPARIEAYYQQACRSWPSHYNAWREYGEWIERSGASLDAMRIWVRGCLRGMRNGRQPVWDLITPYFKRLLKEKGEEALVDTLIAFAPHMKQSTINMQEEPDFKIQLEKWTEGVRDRKLLLKAFTAFLAEQYGTGDYFSQTLSWGAEYLMGKGVDSSAFFAAMRQGLAEKLKAGEKPSIDFNTLILNASKVGNFSAFRRLVRMKEKLEPRQNVGKPFPLYDFDAPLMSREGMLRTSSTSRRDSPAHYVGIIDETACSDKRFYTDNEDMPWAIVVLPGSVEMGGVVIENRCRVQDRWRQVPLEVQVSEDGETWQTVCREEEARETYRFDLKGRGFRAKYVRVQRSSGVGKEPFCLDKILVYGKKLY